MSWNKMDKYKEDAEFKWIDPKKVDTNDVSLWITITVPLEIEFDLLKHNQLHFGKSEHKNAPFTTPAMK